MVIEQPEFCYVVVPASKKGKRIGIVKRGHSGYFETDLDDGTLPTACHDGPSIESYVQHMNHRMGVSETEMLHLITQSMRRS